MVKMMLREMEKSVQTMVKKVRRETMVKPNLPDDIIESNILTKLPVKTLIRFTSVCKSWYSLISDDHSFINLHNQIQKNKITNLLLIDESHENHIFVGFSPEQSYTVNFPYKYLDVVGCSDGVVCVLGTSVLGTSFILADSIFQFQYHIVLWNPALRIKKVIDICKQSLCIGFGYHRRTNDYKVIKISNDSSKLKHAEIYSLTSDSWDQLGANDQLLTGRCAIQQIGVYVSCSPYGAYCWLARKTDEDENFHDYMILSFDMEDKAFKEMMLPYATDLSDENTLFIYKDSLAMLHSRNLEDVYNRRMCYTWVMKEFGDPKSWTMLSKFDSQCLHVSFLGVIETDLIVLRYCFGRITEAVVMDIGKSHQKTANSGKDIELLTKARWVTSFTESLALLKEVHSKISPSN